MTDIEKEERELLLNALDDLLETCELNGMHEDKTYQICKAIYLKQRGGK